jgi:radical SAM protein with 4Fe4S-binding SPASM domain
LRVLSAPVFYALELTWACDNRCPGCSNFFWGGARDSSASPPLGRAGWLQILERVAPHAQRLKLTGGEPTLHPDFPAIVAAIEERAVDFTLFTNARWQDASAMLELLGPCTHLTGLLVSLHGASAPSHEAFTGVPGSFAETVANVRAAIRQKIPVALSTVLTPHSAGELPELLSLVEELGARTLVLNRYMGAPLPEATLSEDALREVVPQIEELRDAGYPLKYGNCVPQCFTPNSSVGCMAGVAYCAIDPWGNLRPCTLSSLRAGNLLERPLEELWRSPVMESFRESIPSGCRRCPAFPSCHGGCKALALELGMEADPLACPSAPPPTGRPPATVVLHPGWRPTGHFTSRSESWGLVLMRGNQLLPVRHEARPLLEALDGRLTVAELQARFGEAALSLVGALYERDMVTFSA